MPISNKTFDSSPDSVNPKLLDHFIKHPTQAYSFNELKTKFGEDFWTDIFVLLILGKIEAKFKGGEYYYRLKKKP